MSSSSTGLPIPEGPGSVSGAPNLPAGFTGTFTSRYVDVGDLRLHAVTGGDGPPLLLVHGWPETWYAWRMLMPALARDFSVIAIDQRGRARAVRDRDPRGVPVTALAERCRDTSTHPRQAGSRVAQFPATRSRRAARHVVLMDSCTRHRVLPAESFRR